MSFYENLPVYKKAQDLVVYFENVVKKFSRYHKYTTGTELRNLSREILDLIAEANTAGVREATLKEVIKKIEKLKRSIRIASEIKAFRSLKNYEFASRSTVDLAKQCEGWLRKCQNSPGIRS
jgi:uncharacterized coiled-coil DUF342 family protein